MDWSNSIRGFGRVYIGGILKQAAKLQAGCSKYDEALMFLTFSPARGGSLELEISNPVSSLEFLILYVPEAT
jgi:hypothetical protein